MNGFYKEDLAYIHHNGFSEFVDKAGDELLKILGNAGFTSGHVIDLGCGTGRWAQKLLSNGYSVLGIDISGPMIALARQTAHEAEFRKQSVYEATLESCAAVTALNEVLNYCTKSNEPSTASLHDLFRKVSSNLMEGGIFAFDIIVQSKKDHMQYRSWSEGADWAVMVEVSEETGQNEIVRSIIIFREIDGCYRRSHEQHRVRVWNGSEIEQLLRKTGFEVEVSHSYGKYSLANRRMTFIGQKRA